jgi:hypothetical protein
MRFPRAVRFLSLTAMSAWLAGCGGSAASPDAGSPDAADASRPDGGDGGLAARGLRITELCAQDDGFLIDERGQTEDWIELANLGDEPIDLSGYALADDGATPVPLAKETLEPGEVRVYFADGELDQGPRHLPFGLKDEGERVRLIDLAKGVAIDSVTFPALGINEAYGRYPEGEGAFARCRYATPGKPNGERCGPPPPPSLPKEFEFTEYTWPAPWPAVPSPVAISEVAARPARFVEIVNATDQPVALAGYALRIAPQAPGEPWPGAQAGAALAFPRATLAPHEAMAVPLTEADVAALAATPDFEGAVTLFDGSGAVVDRVELARPPVGGAVTRFPAPGVTFASCANATPNAANDTCAPVATPAVGDRLRRLGSLAEEAALAAGGTGTASQSVKFVVDMSSGDSVHFLSSRDWALHYTFIRERIYKQPKLNRCDPTESAIFNAGWIDFSNKEYFVVEGRHYLLGTLVRYGSGVKTMEFANGDQINGPLMKRAFFAVMARVTDPQGFAIRPVEPAQILALRAVEGQVPIVDPNAPFRGQTFQPVTTAVAFGLLHFVHGADLQTEPLGPDTIVVTDEVPNDLPLVGGLITEVFQTPLSHVGILSKNRGTPDMALIDARNDPRLAPFLEKLVRLEVTGTGFTVREATAAEAQAWWDLRKKQGPRVAPRLDTTVREPVDLVGRGFADLPGIGAKAAQLAEMMRVNSPYQNCLGPVPAPAGGFAVPLVHSLEHFHASGADAVLARVQSDPAFAIDPRVRAKGLAEVRAAIVKQPVNAQLVSSIEQIAGARFGTERFRMRSSSNTEDLAEFSGAGLYASTSGAIGDPKHRVEDGLRMVWASMWDQRAYDERELALVDHSKAAMGVLIHDAFDQVERANGVAVSRDVLDPTNAESFTINAQAGEAAVTNPAPGVVSDQILYTPYLTPPAEYRARSSLSPAGPVLSSFELSQLFCSLRAVHDHFRSILDPQQKNRWFAMEVEFKFVEDARLMVFKQARPYSFGNAEIPADCREY